ncbi:unnamed protein product [Soboliphyme baturini]|uniref:protein-serine/threonine phosphatase n=1 Tax=Soboliphyme baturini TaxID=241478 RepID=A0A3P7ZU51_9BILA|nr:unnamed protein product [Soboliphyme baturini]
MQVVKVRPSDPDAKRRYNECRKIVKRLAFEKAIRVERTEKTASTLIDLDSMVIEDDYHGPALKDDKVTKEFMDRLVETFRDQKKLHRKFAYSILLQALKYFKTVPSLVEIDLPKGSRLTVCGDVHGQYYDLLNIFHLNGYPSENNPYLFNGDFVDRGSFSVETIFTLLGYKLLYPNHFFMTRGDESNVWFRGRGPVQLVAAGLLGQQKCFGRQISIFIMHGGLFAHDGVTLDDIRKVDRNRQPPEEGVMCDLLWSDPQVLPGRSPSKRGVGIQFGPDVTKRFCRENGLQYIVRSHEVKQEGYEVAHNGQCITVFSAPNYCDTMDNKGAFMTITGNNLAPKFTTFDAVEHPKVRPMAYANNFFACL